MTFELATPGEHWPSGDYVDFAVLDIDESDLGRVFSKNLQEGSEEGMGPWKAVGFKLRDGATVEIIRHERSLEKGFVLRVDRYADAASALATVLHLLGKDESCITWRRA